MSVLLDSITRLQCCRLFGFGWLPSPGHPRFVTYHGEHKREWDFPDPHPRAIEQAFTDWMKLVHDYDEDADER